MTYMTDTNHIKQKIADIENKIDKINKKIVDVEYTKFLHIHKMSQAIDNITYDNIKTHKCILDLMLVIEQNQKEIAELKNIIAKNPKKRTADILNAGALLHKSARNPAESNIDAATILVNIKRAYVDEASTVDALKNHFC